MRDRAGSELGRGPEPNGDENDGLSPEDKAFLNRLADWIAVRRLSVPAVLFLESVKPLNFVGSQFMFFFEPMVKAFVGGQGYTRFASLMESRDNVECFMNLIETAEENARNSEKEEKR